MVWCDMMLYDVVWCCMMLYDVVWCCMMLYDVVWFCMMFHPKWKKTSPKLEPNPKWKTTLPKMFISEDKGASYLRFARFLFNCLYLSQLLIDFGQILDSKSYDQVCKYASMQPLLSEWFIQGKGASYLRFARFFKLCITILLVKLISQSGHTQSKRAFNQWD